MAQSDTLPIFFIMDILYEHKTMNKIKNGNPLSEK